jgi:CubicO group peptidase (beta-lactamase class C family)
MKTKFLSIALFFVACNSGATTIEPATALSQVSLKDGQQQSYEQLLVNTKMPGLSLAIVEDYKIVYTRTAGVKEHGTNQKIDVDTAFSTASISKAVTGTVAAMLAEQGVLDLDVPVSKYLVRWKMPLSNLTKNKPITLRHLLTHTAGMSQGGFTDFYLGDPNIPTLIESLNGVKLPRYKKPISVTFEPGTSWNYSGGGYVIAQVAMEDITGKSLAQLAEEMIFKPLNMTNTTMYQHGNPKFLTNVAKAHDRNQEVIGTGIPICPQIAPSGMWSTAVDMAKWVIDYQKALAGKKSTVISPWVAKETTRIHTTEIMGGWGLGWMRLETDGNLDWFSHGGANTGVGGHVMATMKGGRAILVFGNGPNGIRMPAIDTLRASVVKAMGWKTLIVASSQKADSAVIKSMTGRYLGLRGEVVTVQNNGGTLMMTDGQGSDKSRALIYVGNGRFEIDQFNSQMDVQVNPADGHPYLAYYRKGTDFKSYAMRKLANGVQLPTEVASSGGFEAALAAYQKWQQQYPSSNFASANALNRAGYTQLMQKNFIGALNIFRVYTALHPQDANAFDSLGEAYMTAGDKPKARKSYARSLALNPDNTNAKNMLDKLKM